MTVGAVYCLYEDYKFLKYSIDSIYSVVDKIIFLVGDTAWNGDQSLKGDNEKTLQVINEYKDVDDKFVLIKKQWEQGEIHKRNYGLDIVRNFKLDYCLVIDADEVYETKELKFLIDTAKINPQYSVFRCPMYTYWKEVKYRIEPPEQYCPCVLLKCTDTMRFVENRDATDGGLQATLMGHCTMHHFSYVRTDEELKRKHIFVPGHNQSAIAGWFDNVWKAWDNNKFLLNIHPVWPEVYKRAIEIGLNELPSVMGENHD